MLAALPPQPEGVAWPTQAWPTGPAVAAIEALADELHGDTDRFGTTYATAVVIGGRLVHERYGGELPKWDKPPEPVLPGTPLLSWSMAKSVLHAAVGILVGEGRLRLDAPAPVAAWHRDPDDPRGAITLDQLLAMRDGLQFSEDYVDGATSNTIEMLFGSGMPDMAAYAVARPLAHEPGTVFNYSSGTSNIVARIAGDAIGDGSADAQRAWFAERIFEPIGMQTATLRFDDAGTFVGSSYVYATARDWARFGLLYLRGGEWDGTAVLPADWVDHARTERSTDTDDWRYGAHWWVENADGPIPGAFWANGYEGQAVLCDPVGDAVVVRLGRSDAAMSEALRDWRRRITLAARAVAAG